MKRLAALDFWVGHWSVALQSGEPAGTDLVERVLDGYVILEHWRNVAGVEGKSCFWFDAAADTWQQVWVFAGTVTRKELAVAEPGRVRFDGHAGTTPARTTLTANTDGTVRQLIEHSDDGGACWEPVFDAVYTRLALPR